jgi:hypothetical protein
MGVKYVAATAPGRKRMKRWRDPARDRRSTPRLMTDNAGIIWKRCPIHRSRSASHVIALIGLTDAPAKQIACERRSYDIHRPVRSPTRRQRRDTDTAKEDFRIDTGWRTRVRL